MTATIELRTEELNYQLFRKLKSMFKGQKIKIMVDSEIDETEYLLSDESNKRFLEQSIAQARRREIVTVTLDDLK
jgi:hypothetical protein